MFFTHAPKQAEFSGAPENQRVKSNKKETGKIMTRFAGSKMLTAITAIWAGLIWAGLTCCLLSPALAETTTAGQFDKIADGASDINLPLKPERTISFTTDEGTWMSLDVSPDGKEIVFDLVGDLYVIPITGGEARRLTSGMAWDSMPRYSPDGRHIAFISDRNGSENLWLMTRDGGDAKAISNEIDHTPSSPAWTPDGEYIVARRFGPYPEVGNYLDDVPLWMYHKDVGKGFKIYPAEDKATTNSGVTFSQDGVRMYFSSHAGGFAGAELGKYQVVEFDRTTGEARQITARHGGGLRPIVSPDGRYLVYATRRDALTALRIRDLETNREEWLVAGMQRDDQEGYAPNDILPGYSFTPDSRAVVFTGGGKIKRVEIASKQVSTIPFHAVVEQQVASRIHFSRRIDDGPLPVRQLSGVNQSPDGKYITYSAIGKVWVTDLQSGKSRRLTKSPLREYAPVYSPDGRWIAYLILSDNKGMQIVKTSVRGDRTIPLSPEGGSYQSVTWSPSGEKVVYYGLPHTSPTCQECANSELGWVSARGGKKPSGHQILVPEQISGSVTVTDTERDGERVYFVGVGVGVGEKDSNWAAPPKYLISVKMDGSDRREHALFIYSDHIISGAGLTDIKPSPDGKWLLLINIGNAHVMQLPEVGGALSIDLSAVNVPMRQLTQEGANYTQWADDGRTLAWSFANHFYRVPLADVTQGESIADWRAQEFAVTLTAQRAIPKGKLYLRGARLITMRGEEVITKGDMLIENNRIVSVGPSSDMQPPPDALVMDLAGKTLMPGLVDIHSHPETKAEIVPEQYWKIANFLSYGVTTTRDPASSRGTFRWQELVESGEMVGPRLYGTGDPLTTTHAPIKSYEDALHIVRRYKKQGANSIKQYLQPRRIQRQWIRMAAQAEGMNTTNEGAGDLKADITMALDGFTGLEHSISVAPLYKDIVEVLAQSGITYTPTLIVAYGGPEGEQYWGNRWDIHNDAKLRRLTPHHALDSEWRRKRAISDDDYHFPIIARGVRDIVRAGGHAGLGSHGNQEGLGAQWELWMLASGGMALHETLRVATMHGAESIGLAKDIGSLEPGKLADILVLSANPLDDIRNTNKIHYVIKNGVVYQGDTLDEVWPMRRKFPKFYWQNEDESWRTLSKE